MNKEQLRKALGCDKWSDSLWNQIYKKALYLLKYGINDQHMGYNYTLELVRIIKDLARFNLLDLHFNYIPPIEIGGILL